VPPRRGRQRFQRMILVWAAVILVSIMVGTFFLLKS
jgi:hypothetical protein